MNQVLNADEAVCRLKDGHPTSGFEGGIVAEYKSRDSLRDHFESLTTEAPIGEEVERWLANKGFSAEVETQLVGGRSGALVFRVVLHSEGASDRRAILKIDAYEPVLSTSLIAEPPAFEGHLVRELWPPLVIEDAYMVSIQELAGGDLGDWRPLSSLSGRADSRSGVLAVVTSLLREWNGDASECKRSIVSLVGERAVRRLGADGAVTKWVRSQYDDEVQTSVRLRFPENASRRTFVNPLWLMEHPEASMETHRTLNGRSHGDLHADNVFLPIKGMPDPSRFRLIDLASMGMRSLSDDSVNLLLSEVERYLASHPHLLAPLAEWLINNDRGAAPLDLDSLIGIWLEVESTGLAFATELGFGAEWHLQHWCSIMGSSLVLVSRDRLSESIRTWFFLLAALAAEKVADLAGIEAPDNSIATVGLDESDDLEASLKAAARISDQCSHFDGTTASIVIVAPSVLDTWTMVDLASVPWNVLIDFDSLTTEPGGAHSFVVEVGVPVQLIQPGQGLVPTHNKVVWLAANGLAAPGADQTPEYTLREWRTRFMADIRKSLDQFASAQSMPVKVVLFGDPDDRARAVVEQALESLGNRASLIVVPSGESRPLEGYEPEVLRADPVGTVRKLPKHDASQSEYQSAPTIPAGEESNGRVVVPENQRGWFDDKYELLHSLTGLDSHAVDGVGTDFYRGRGISWYELSLNVDLPRAGSHHALVRAVEVKLEKRSTERHTYRHYPGAGGTTMVRRLAWDLRNRFPTLVVNQPHDDAGIVSRVQELARLSGRPVFVVIENASERITDAVFEQLRANSVPSLLLLSGRHSQFDDKYDLARDLPAMSDDEIVEFTRLFSAQRPENRKQINAVGTGSATPVPFLFALATFQEEFVGIDQYVRRFMEAIPEEMHRSLALIALVHRYAGVSIQASAFAKRLGYPPDQPTRLARHFGPTIDGLLLEEKAGYWRTIHSRVAEAVLQAQLSPKVGLAASSEDGWRLGLAEAARELIKAIAEACTTSLTDDMREVLEAAFIRRNAHDLTRPRYSELLSELSSDSRGQILELLTEEFPEEPHFWAHWGRWLSFDKRLHPRARECFDKALELQERDSLLWHMRGTASRRELFDYLDAHRQKNIGGISEAEVMRKVDTLSFEALADFEMSWQIDDTSDYPLDTAAELCIRVIEWGKRRSGVDTYSAFLGRPSSALFTELLDAAEIAVDRAEELTADDSLSDRFRRLKAQLNGIYDNFPAMISDWRNLINSADPARRLSLRSRVARLYGARNGAWHLASDRDISSALELLNDNLRDDPADPLSARLWLRAARHKPVSLERAQEVVSNWVEFDKSRDALYHDYMLSALASLSGGLVSLEELAEKLEKVRAKSSYHGTRRAVTDWYGSGEGLQRLLHRSQLNWERRSQDPPATLERVPGRIFEIRGNTSGVIELQSGLRAFFTPAYGGFHSGETNTPVTAVLGFSLDGLRAWNVVRRT